MKRLLRGVLFIAVLLILSYSTALAQPPGAVLIAASGDGGVTRVKNTSFRAYTTLHADASALQIVPEHMIGWGWNSNLAFNDSSWISPTNADAHSMGIWTRFNWLNSPPPGGQVMCFLSDCFGRWQTYAYRRKFKINVPVGKTLDKVYLYTWSDNKSAWYINGTLVQSNYQQAGPVVDITAYVTPGGTDNLLAFQVSNDNDNPSGEAWSIWATYLEPPAIDVHVKNPQGTPVAVNQICTGSGNGYLQTTNTCVSNRSGLLNGSVNSSYTTNGAFINSFNPRLRVLGVTPVPGGGSYGRTWARGRPSYNWPTWSAGVNSVDFVVATITPTPTPTNTPTPANTPTPTATFTPTPTPTNTPTPTATFTPTPTPTNTPTPTATFTPTPVATPTPTNTPPPSGLTLNRDYPYLVLFAPDVGMPAQTLRGQLSGWGVAFRTVTVQVTRPDLTVDIYTVTTDIAGRFVLDDVAALDTYFGVRQAGTWYATATYTPTGLLSVTVDWLVDWKPGHLND